MEYSSPFPLCEALDEYRAKKERAYQEKRAANPRNPGRVAKWPSLASFKQLIVLPGGFEEFRVVGACLRQSYYSALNIVPTEDKGARVMDAGIMGQALEDAYVEDMLDLDGFEVLHPTFDEKGRPKQLRIDHRGITGKVDIVLRHLSSGQVFGVEMKTYDNPRNAISLVGYDKAKAIYKSLTPFIPKFKKGSRKILNPERFKKPMPKDSHLLQVAIYLDALWDQGITLFKLIYVARDRGPRAEFDVSLAEVNGKKYVVLNNELLEEWCLDGIYARFDELEDHVLRQELPERDFVPEYSSLQLLEDSTTPEWLKKKLNAGEIHRDWQCEYCPFLGKCLDDSPDTESVDIGLF